MKKSRKKLRIMNLKNMLLILSLLATLVNYFYLFYFNSFELSPGFWALIIWIIVVIIGGIIYTLGRKSVIKHDDLTSEFKEQIRKVDESNGYTTYLTYAIILGNLPCWYFQQSSAIMYLPLVILALAFLPWKKFL
ncbi:hypothetical protein JW886_05780 [Lactococcus taiwanensis]|uniref:Uncharacterized protein n=1 Tax=Lactococcus taiwanensis TaxID=1151742 RepID=A0AA45QQP8_9LACT|nr:hypothetical protein [Lactococcus taiwanensis]QSE75987.1 hypothetical protein JW886_05780 [Lactococcus taiwanensis]